MDIELVGHGLCGGVGIGMVKWVLSWMWSLACCIYTVWWLMGSVTLI